MLFTKSKQLGGIMLIAGTAIGIGMLASPIATGSSGIVASILLLISMFAFTLVSLFVFLEALYYSTDPSTNLIGICERLSGHIAAIVAWTLFLGLLYIVSAAYILAVGGIIANSHTSLSPYPLSCGIGFAFVFAFIAYFGMAWIDRANRALTIGLLLFFIALISLSSKSISIQNLSGGDPARILQAVPAVITAFTYQIILPSIRQYLDNDLKQLKQTVLIGITIPLILYIIWHIVILGLIPYEGDHSLASILAQGGDQLTNMTKAIDFSHNLASFGKMIAGFSFFAISTSFWGVMVSLMDFLTDGLQLNRFAKPRLYALGLAFIPPLLLALLAPSTFLGFVTYAGIIILVLYGILPAYLVWNARYNLQLQSTYTLPGGKATLLIVGGIASALLVLSVYLS
jgi:tyrosine-specific transport protein